MRCRETVATLLASALLIASLAAAQTPTYTTKQCREVARCTTAGTLAYAFLSSCLCCTDPPTGTVSPLQCSPATLNCPALTHCTSCATDPTRCDACASEYVLNPATKTCTQCLSPMCDICQAASEGKRCLLCSEDYYWLSGSECQPVSGGQAPGTNPQCRAAFCRACASTTTATCTECDTGYTLDGAGLCRGACNVKSCDMCYTGDTNDCQLCAAGNAWSATGCSAAANACRVGHCTTCQANDNSRCTTCETGYTPTNGYCFSPSTCFITHCASCPDDPAACSQCANGYVLVNGECVRCQVEHCATCRNGDSTVCSSCETGYYVSSGSCLPVQACYVSNCAQCMLTDSTKCLKCMDGYLTTSAYRCVPQKVVNGAAAPHSLWVVVAVLLASVATH